MGERVKLTDEHQRVLTAMDCSNPDFGYRDFATIAADAEMDRAKTRRIVRHLARKGLAQFAKGLWGEGGEPRGSGYAITDAGRAALNRQEPT